MCELCWISGVTVSVCLCVDSDHLDTIRGSVWRRQCRSHVSAYFVLVLRARILTPNRAKHEVRSSRGRCLYLRVTLRYVTFRDFTVGLELERWVCLHTVKKVLVLSRRYGRPLSHSEPRRVGRRTSRPLTVRSINTLVYPSPLAVTPRHHNHGILDDCCRLSLHADGGLGLPTRVASSIVSVDAAHVQRSVHGRLSRRLALGSSVHGRLLYWS